MSKRLLIIIGLAIVGVIALAIFSNSARREQIIGVKHDSQGQEHIQRYEDHEPYNSDLPSSGPHFSDESAPTKWGIYTEEIQPEVYIHNIEHGGVVIAYNPELLQVAEQQKLRVLFTSVDQNKTFKPKKYIIMPRKDIATAIQMAAWLYTLDLSAYNEDKLIKFFSQRAGKAPEGTAGPLDAPINQMLTK